MVTADALETSLSRSSPWRAAPPLEPSDFTTLRRQLILSGYKWDPQVGDVSTIAPFPILIPASQWRQLADLAQRLAAELMLAENELLTRPDLHSQLGLPRRLRRLFATSVDRLPTPPAARVLRFDFHWTTDGWRISEVNSDVPGGFTEASNLPALMAAHYPGTTPAGDPAAMWADAIALSAHGCKHVALLAAAGFMEDQQIMSYLASLLAQRGIRSSLALPHQLHWTNGSASLQTNWHRGPVGAIVRFYQAEWLANLPPKIGWQHLFFSGNTPVANPGISTLTESKRFPLVWDHLTTPLQTWRELLPESRDPRRVPWATDDNWLVKSAYCNTGDTVAIRG
ncbi:MAG: glutathionylspermidine synthase family protein, partial [Tepidisphaeraceae bacterium]